jgi:hypothetical protein
MEEVRPAACRVRFVNGWVSAVVINIAQRRSEVPTRRKPDNPDPLWVDAVSPGLKPQQTQAPLRILQRRHMLFETRSRWHFR